MKKRYKYTILTVLFALMLSMGSLAGMNVILKVRERQLLTESGSVQEETPAVKEQEGENRYAYQVGSELTPEQIQDAFRDRATVRIHSPVEGQISKEEAIQAGEEWLAAMELDGKGLGKPGERITLYANLTVSTEREPEEVLLKPYYSFWEVEISSITVSGFLYVNAVTGKVWRASIQVCKVVFLELSHEKLKRFVELSGVTASEDWEELKKFGRRQRRLGSDTDIVGTLLLDEDGLCAQMNYYSWVTHPEGGNDKEIMNYSSSYWFYFQ